MEKYRKWSDDILWLLSEEMRKWENYNNFTFDFLNSKNIINEDFFINNKIMLFFKINSISELIDTWLINNILGLSISDFIFIEKKLNLLWITNVDDFKNLYHKEKEIYNLIINNNFFIKNKLISNNQIVFLLLKNLHFSERNELLLLFNNENFIKLLNSWHLFKENYFNTFFNITTIIKLDSLLKKDNLFEEYQYFLNDYRWNKQLFIEKYNINNINEYRLFLWNNLHNIRYLLEKTFNSNLKFLFEKYPTKEKLEVLFTKKSFNLLKRSCSKDNPENFKYILERHSFTKQSSNKTEHKLNIIFDHNIWGWCPDADIHNLKILSWLQSEYPIHVKSWDNILWFIKRWIVESYEWTWFRKWDNTFLSLIDYYEDWELVLIKWWNYSIKWIKNILEKLNNETKIQLWDISESNEPFNINYLGRMNIDNELYKNYLKNLHYL